MNRLQLTRFGLRLLGIALLVPRAIDGWQWVREPLRILPLGYRADARVLLLQPFQHWSQLWPAKTEWLFLVALGLVLVFRNAWLAKQLWRGLDQSGCPACGYDRSGLAVGAPCPECGAT